MKRAEKAERIRKILYRLYPLPPIPLRHRDPFTLLIGVLGGLHAGLQAASYELTLAVGCDMPFLKTDLLRAFADWAEGFDIALLRRGEHVEPLHAAYRRTCLPPIEAVIRGGKRRVVSFFPRVEVRYVTLEEVALIDPYLDSFRNVNTPAEWEAARLEWSET